MVRKRQSPVLLLLGALLLVPLATGASAVVSATATITGSGTSYRLTVRNTGDEPLKCVGLLLEGVQPTAASGPAGVLTRVGTFQGRGLVHMQGDLVVAPGAAVTVQFTTNVPISANAGGELRYSSTCAAGSDQISRATGPPPPAPPPCECESFDARITFVDKYLEEKTTHIRLKLGWTLECSGGAGRCKGRLTVRVPRKFRRASVEDNLSQPCAGACKGRTSGTRAFSFRSGNPTTRSDSIVMRVQFECAGEKRERLYTMRFRGRDNTTIDLKRSDLNGNQVPDAKD